jgi:CRP-like cAMP-binding protein
MKIDPRIFGYIVNEESYPDKFVIIKENSCTNWIYVVLEGKVKVKKQTPKGLLTISKLKKGSVFGELLFLQMGGERRTASVVADGPVKVGLLDMMRLNKEYQSVSPLLKDLISTLAKRLQESTAQLVAMTVK